MNYRTCVTLVPTPKKLLTHIDFPHFEICVSSTEKIYFLKIGNYQHRQKIIRIAY
jgi:hypothetical protein